MTNNWYARIISISMNISINVTWSVKTHKLTQCVQNRKKREGNTKHSSLYWNLSKPERIQPFEEFVFFSKKKLGCKKSDNIQQSSCNSVRAMKSKAHTHIDIAELLKDTIKSDKRFECFNAGNLIEIIRIQNQEQHERHEAQFENLFLVDFDEWKVEFRTPRAQINR